MTMEKSTVWRCISYETWWFSIALLVYQRVGHPTNGHRSQSLDESILKGLNPRSKCCWCRIGPKEMKKKSLQEIKMDSWIPYMYIYIYSNIRIYFFVQKGGSVACCPVPPAIICSYSSGSLLEPVILQGWRKVLEATRRSRIQWVIKNRKNMSVNVDVCATRLLPKVEFVARCC